MDTKTIRLNSLNYFSLAFHGMSLNDFILLAHIADKEGINHDQLLEASKFEEKKVQASLRKLTGSRLATKSCRYRLVKEAPVSQGTGYFLTSKGREYIQLF